MNDDSHMTQIKGFATPLVQAALDAALAGRAADAPPALLAISGLQGSGKSTLADQVVARATAQGLQAACLSIDDVYLTRAERQRLAADVHPLLATRGPPGTHDVALALHTLDAIAQRRPCTLPRFDKLADDRLAEAQWPRIDAPLDLLVIEGWFLGTPAQDTSALVAPVNALERDEDADGRWRRYCNAALARDYPRLWQRFDRLWMLAAPDFAVVPGWRAEQERAAEAREPGRRGMDATQIARFVQFYERISRHALATLPALADRVIRLDAQRQPLR